MAFPFDAEDLKQRLAALEEAATGFADAEATRQVQDFGARLFNALFAGDIRSAYERSRQATIEHSQGLRVRLRINAPELATLPWEFLFDPIAGDFLALSRAMRCSLPRSAHRRLRQADRAAFSHPGHDRQPQRRTAPGRRAKQRGTGHRTAAPGRPGRTYLAGGPNRKRAASRSAAWPLARLPLRRSRGV